MPSNGLPPRRHEGLRHRGLLGAVRRAVRDRLGAGPRVPAADHHAGGIGVAVDHSGHARHDHLGGRDRDGAGDRGPDRRRAGAGRARGTVPHRVHRARPRRRRWNRGKESLVADLRIAAGQEQLWELAHSADVVIEGFSPGTTAAWGVGADVLCAANPGLVHCAVTGFGTTGPYAGLKGYDALVCAKAGLFTRGRYGHRPGAIFYPVRRTATAS
ncbi:MAG TPA: CoA transferase [Streptosporangiaceae bacterium]|nr:CoA transferase [Streptosporangiaceae bacterium]